LELVGVWVRVLSFEHLLDLLASDLEVLLKKLRELVTLSIDWKLRMVVRRIHQSLSYTAATVAEIESPSDISGSDHSR
jgi:hypothetical protein